MSKSNILHNVRLTIADRLPNSVNGNPRFRVFLRHEDDTVTLHKTKSDAACSYEVTNVDGRGPVDVEVTPSGNISRIWDYS